MPNLVEVHETIKEKKDKIQQTIYHSIKISRPRPSIMLFIFQLEVLMGIVLIARLNIIDSTMCVHVINFYMYIR